MKPLAFVFAQFIDEHADIIYFYNLFFIVIKHGKISRYVRMLHSFLSSLAYLSTGLTHWNFDPAC